MFILVNILTDTLFPHQTYHKIPKSFTMFILVNILTDNLSPHQFQSFTTSLFIHRIGCLYDEICLFNENMFVLCT